MHFSCVSSLVITAARPTSEPVPAVVGTATTGGRPAVWARRQLSPRSSKSQIGRSWAAMKAIALAASSALPPPSAITPSWPPLRSASTPAATSAPVGLGRTSANSATGRPARAIASTRSPIACPARPGSVIRSGRAMPSAAQASGSSAIRPAPNRTVVG